LRSADLRRAVLTDACLEHANLLPYDRDSPAQLNAPHLRNGSDPSQADGSNLTITKLGEANLRGADLSDAFLYRANLVGTNLVGTDLRRSDLRGANLKRADLADADLTGARYDAETSWPESFAPQRVGAVAP
jgi:uncharacterized protein YjbI with pentapeptide repeats